MRSLSKIKYLYSGWEIDKNLSYQTHSLFYPNKRMMKGDRLWAGGGGGAVVQVNLHIQVNRTVQSQHIALAPTVAERGLNFINLALRHQNG